MMIVMRRQNNIILWPVYFDSTKTRSQGRRVSKKLATATPKLDEIKRAADMLSLESEIVTDVAYPGIPWLKTGLVKLPKGGAKTQIIRDMAKKISENRIKP